MYYNVWIITKRNKRLISSRRLVQVGIYIKKLSRQLCAHACRDEARIDRFAWAQRGSNGVFFFSLSDGGPTRPEAQWAQPLHLTGILLRFGPWRASLRRNRHPLPSALYAPVYFIRSAFTAQKVRLIIVGKNIPHCGAALQRHGRVGVRRSRSHYRPMPPFDPHPTHSFLQTKPSHRTST